jgi:hypothetical protein
MFEKENLNSVAIFDLFHVIPMDFQLSKSTFFKFIINLKNLSFNKIYDHVAINKAFNTIIFSFHSTLLFLSNIFNPLLRIFKNREISIKIWGGGE